MWGLAAKSLLSAATVLSWLMPESPDTAGFNILCADPEAPPLDFQVCAEIRTFGSNPAVTQLEIDYDPGCFKMVTVDVSGYTSPETPAVCTEGACHE